MLTKASQWLNNADNYSLLIDDNAVKAIPSIYINDIDLLKSSLRVINDGISVADIKGHDLIPHLSLAMSCECNTEVFDTFAVSYALAIAYLRKKQ